MPRRSPKPDPSLKGIRPDGSSGGLAPDFTVDFAVVRADGVFHLSHHDQDRDGDERRHDRDMPEAETAGETDGSREPHASACRDTRYFSTCENDETGRQKGNAAGDRLHETRRVHPDILIVEYRHVDEFQRDDREGSRGEADEHMRLQSRWPPAPFPFKANDGPEQGCQQHSRQYYRQTDYIVVREFSPELFPELFHAR